MIPDPPDKPPARTYSRVSVRDHGTLLLDNGGDRWIWADRGVWLDDWR